VSLPHFFVDRGSPDAVVERSRIQLSSEDSRHALRSLRLRAGAALTVSNNCGRVAEARLVSDERGIATLEIGSVCELRPPQPHVTIAMAPPKGDRLSWATQKLAELGVDELQLVTTDRAVRTAEHDRTLDRQMRIARDAAMQSRRPFITFVRDERFENALTAAGTGSPDLRLLLWEGAGRPLRAAWTEEPERVTVLVGPEGSFTSDEIAAAERAGFLPVSLGGGILRTETAAVVGAALVLARYGRLG
jgi:16S rRNA (uracil1498-N3)-methyltransferase